MLITRKSPFTGASRSMNIAVTKEQIDAWRAGELIQNAMPNVSTEEREFIMSGMLSDEFDRLFKESDDA